MPTLYSLIEECVASGKRTIHGTKYTSPQACIDDRRRMLNLRMRAFGTSAPKEVRWIIENKDLQVRQQIVPLD